MRSIFRLILLTLAMALLTVGSLWCYRYLSSAEFTHSGLRLDGTLKRKEVYSIGHDSWLEFPVSGIHDALRISSFARLRNRREDYRADTEFFYTLEYQILDDQNSPLLHDTYQVRSFLPDLFYSAGGEYTETKYLDGLVAPVTAGKFFDLDLTALKNAYRIRLRVFETDNPISEVLVRVLMHHQLRNDQAHLRWLRLGADKQNRITAYHVFPWPLMTPREINDRVAQRWYPKAPTGTGFETRTLYSHNVDEDDMFLEDRPPGIGRSLSKTLRVTAIVPETTRLDLSFKPLSSAIPDQFKITIRYWNHLLQQPDTHLFTLDSGTSSLHKTFAPGFIEVTAEYSFQVVITSPELDEHEINLLYKLNVFQLDPQAMVSYDLQTLTGLGTDLRIDIRVEQPATATAGKGGAGAAGEVDAAISQALNPRYRIVDAAGKVLSSGKLDTPTGQSAYDLLITQRDWRHVSDKNSHFLRVPKTTRYLQLSGDPNTYVAVYSRPSGLPLRRVTPRDYRTWEHRGGRIPEWFLMLPANDTDLTLAARKQQITIQPRPPTRNADILAGLYDWQEIAPRDDALGKPLLATPFHNTQPREAAAGNFYAPLIPGQPVALLPAAGLDTVTPTLLFQRAQTTPRTVTVKTGNKYLGNFFIQGRTGMLPLPPLPAGTHNLSISGTDRDTHWFINRCRCNFTRQQRFAYLFNGRNMVFDIEKTGPGRQNFTLVVFPPAGNAQQIELDVAIEGLPVPTGPRNAWTLGDLYFILESDGGIQEGFELDYQARPLGRAQRLPISLGEDVPAGRYRLRVRSATGPAPLMQLYSIRAEPGVAQFFTEDM